MNDPYNTDDQPDFRDRMERQHALNRAFWDVSTLTLVARNIHRLNRHFYRDPVTKLPTGNVGEKIALIHSELSEMLEGARKELMDDHLPDRKAEEVEAADVFIRLADYCGWRGLDLAGAVRDKLKYNTMRQDHTDAARTAVGGKKF